MDRLTDYDYHLPPELIAQTPLQERTASRLLVLDRSSGSVSHRNFADVPTILRCGDLLVFNDTRVTALRLIGHKVTGGEVEALLLREIQPFTYEALVKPGRRVQLGTVVRFQDELTATVKDVLGEGRRRIEFEPSEGFAGRLARVGRVPLPPYIHEELLDSERYQTVLARTGGSAAAPTAGLHFSQEMLGRLQQVGVELATVTLDVGIDTFRPVQVDDLDEHRMHGEVCEIPEETASKIAACGGRIVAVGTTSVRTLESRAIGPRRVEPGRQTTDLFIRPGYHFQVIDGMFTNFHLPRTTMLIMLSALVDQESILAAYGQAVRQNYRFLSFGDSMLIL